MTKYAVYTINNDPSLPENLMVPQVSTLLGVSPKTVLRRIRSGALPAKKQGKHWYCSKQKLLDWLKEDPEPITPIQAAHIREGLRDLRRGNVVQVAN